MKALVCALMLTVAFAGCARMSRFGEGSASPNTQNPQSDKVSCDMSGGKWNAYTRNCDR
jgi:hypothetical protein